VERLQLNTASSAKSRFRQRLLKCVLSLHRSYHRKNKACAADHTWGRRGSVPLLRQVLDWLNKVVATLAEIFIVRLEAAARLQEQTASLSSSVFPVHPEQSIRI
jgi:hypothetical protein